MSLQKKIKLRTQRRAFRVRSALQNRAHRMRVSVFRSAKHISAQIIDDQAQKTVVSLSSLSLEKGNDKKADLAKRVGLELGKKALAQEIKDVLFDRGHYLYHGRVKALADGLREAGLNF